jgi:hypothetical protein
VWSITVTASPVRTTLDTGVLGYLSVGKNLVYEN